MCGIIATMKRKYIVVAIIGCIFIATLGAAGKEKKTEQRPDPTQKQEVKKATFTPSPTEAKQITPTLSPGNMTFVKVKKVVDGDTFQTEDNKTVRMIGIDTPETVDPRKPVQCYGKEASAKTKALIENQTVGLIKDISETDKYGRLLRYVYKDKVFINEFLVQEGFARASSYPPDIAEQEAFHQAEQEAREQGKGLWDGCASQSSTTQKQTSQSTSAPTKQQTTNTGDDKDCSDFATHDEAQAYFTSKGGSPSNNVDKLDNNHDGIACESLK